VIETANKTYDVCNDIDMTRGLTTAPSDVTTVAVAGMFFLISTLHSRISCIHK